jgi:hypothetical protein
MGLIGHIWFSVFRVGNVLASAVILLMLMDADFSLLVLAGEEVLPVSEIYAIILLQK